MKTVYLLDDMGIYAGPMDIDPMSALPRCTLTPPPELDGEQVAQWFDDAWRVLPAYPQLPGPSADQLQEIAAAQAAREQAKANRQAAVDAIKVTTAAGNTFDGDEISQTRMARAILAMQATGTQYISWVLADNTPATVSLAELAEALALAGAEQTLLWVSA